MLHGSNNIVRVCPRKSGVITHLARVLPDYVFYIIKRNNKFSFNFNSISIQFAKSYNYAHEIKKT